MKWSGNADQVLREIGEDAPVVSFIGVRQGRASNPTTESHVVELAAHRFQARLNVAETLAVSETERRPSPDTDPSKTDFCGVDRRHSESHTSGTRGGRDERSVARKRFGRHSSPIVPQMRGPAIQLITAVFSSNRFRAECQLFYGWQRTCRTSQSTLPDTSDVIRTNVPAEALSSEQAVRNYK